MNYYSINKKGFSVIEKFLLENLKAADGYVSREQLEAWADDAQAQANVGNGARIEIISYDAVGGVTVNLELDESCVDSTPVL